MTSLYYPPKFDSGLAGAKLTFTITGTTTPQNTYTDEALTVESSNPVVADANGVFAPIYLDPRAPSYRVRYETAAGVLIYQQDGVPSNQNTGSSVSLQSITPYVQFYDTDGVANQRKMRLQLGLDGLYVIKLNDAESVQTLVETIFWDIPSSQGTFTGTLTGMSGSTTGTVTYRIVRGMCTLYLDNVNITGTSNTTAMTMTGLPSAVIPTQSRSMFCKVVDNNVEMVGGCSVGTGPSIIFSAMSVSGSRLIYGTFTNSGVKGLFTGWTITYPI